MNYYEEDLQQYSINDKFSGCFYLKFWHSSSLSTVDFRTGLKTNCYKFITMVTGCSACTIARVEEQMRKTGGDREPPPHGLKKYWETQPRAAKPTKKPMEPIIPPSISLATGQRNPLSQTLLDEVS